MAAGQSRKNPGRHSNVCMLWQVNFVWWRLGQAEKTQDVSFNIHGLTRKCRLMATGPSQHLRCHSSVHVKTAPTWHILPILTNTSLSASCSMFHELELATSRHLVQRADRYITNRHENKSTCLSPSIASSIIQIQVETWHLFFFFCFSGARMYNGTRWFPTPVTVPTSWSKKAWRWLAIAAISWICETAWSFQFAPQKGSKKVG